MPAVSMTKQSDAHSHVAQGRPPFDCIALVLQGGGALGAYQAGVYQALDEAKLDPDWICGISIGAFNSAIIAGNPPGTRVEKLREFWESVTQPYVDWEQPPGWEVAEAEAAAAASLAPQPSDFWNFACKWVPGLNADSSRGFLNQWSAGRVLWNGTPNFFALRPVTPWFWPGTSVRATSYYDTTALKSTLERLVDFDRINHGPMRLSVGAVTVRTGNFVYFDTTKDRIRAEHIMASGALPPAFSAVEVDGEHYWDGSYAGNPAIFPLVYECDCCDILMVHITPSERPGVPTNSPAIMNRMQEISFNTALIREMRTIAFLNRLVDEGRMDGGKHLRVHLIEAEDLIRGFSWSSRLNSDWDFLMHLHQLGRARADQWLSVNFDRIGIEPTVDLQEKYF
jgi:NTE family protein